ncbi:MAG: RidA family protein [Bdellovibrionales bacterium]|nr:RidA family protein [Bdellovibrionales bacterium]
MVKYINGAEGAPGAIGPYSQATVVGNLAFLSGQVPIDPSTGKLVEGGIEEQTDQVMQNLSAVLRKLGADFSNVCKTTILLKDLSHFATVNELYGTAMGEAKPARATFQVAGLPLGALVEIEMIAQISE